MPCSCRPVRVMSPMWYWHNLVLSSPSSWTPAQIEKRLTNLHLVDKLTSEGERFATYMLENVRSHIPGTDLARLLLFYKLIESCPGETNDAAANHRKLLGKLVSAAPGEFAMMRELSSPTGYRTDNSDCYLHWYHLVPVMCQQDWIGLCDAITPL